MSEATTATIVGAVTAGLIELAKMGLQIWFAATKQLGLTDEQQLQLYKEQKQKFIQNDPDKLPDV